jgi:cytochrome c-type biogenesis protein CcmH
MILRAPRLLAIAVLLTLGSAGASAQGAGATAISDSALEARTREVASRLRCPVCQGLSLQDSPSELSQEMRDVVREQLRAGKSAKQVEQYFVARYGEWILMEPSRSGFNWTVYALPWLAVVGGGLVIARAVRRWTRREMPREKSQPPPSSSAESAPRIGSSPTVAESDLPHFVTAESVPDSRGVGSASAERPRR